MKLNKKRIYLDNAATTAVDPHVTEAMLPFFSGTFGNASSVHSFGQEAKIALERSRETVASLFHAQPSEIIFTSGGTEADNYAIKGVVLQLLASGKNHIITTRAEHQAVLKTCEYLEENGIQVTYIPVDRQAVVDPDTIRKSITPQTALITIMHANNEIGTLNPIREISVIAREHAVVFHSDTTQSAGKIDLDHDEYGFDIAVASAHKLHGPKGIGALYVRRGIELERWSHGGPQERGRRGGTENVPLAVGFARAVELFHEERVILILRFRKMKKILAERIKEISPHIILNGDWDSSLPNILHISFPSSHFSLEGETLLMNMDLDGVAVSSGSACTSGSIEPSHVLLAMGYDEKTADASLRFSFGRYTLEEEVITAANVLARIVRDSGKL